MDNEQARLELDRLIRTNGTSYAAMSRLLRRNPAYVQQYIRRGVPDRLEKRDRRLLADFFGIEERLLDGSAPEPGQSAALVMVPKLDVQASAGPGAALDGEATLAHYGFDRRWLKELSRGKPEDLSIVRVRGDSMAPTLIDGDDILVDRVDGSTRLRDGIYVLQREDALLVKRLALSPATGKLTIASDNPAYPSWADCAVSDVRIVGRVVWTGRRLG